MLQMVEGPMESLARAALMLPGQLEVCQPMRRLRTPTRRSMLSSPGRRTCKVLRIFMLYFSGALSQPADCCWLSREAHRLVVHAISRNLEHRKADVQSNDRLEVEECIPLQILEILTRTAPSAAQVWRALLSETGAQMKPTQSAPQEKVSAYMSPSFPSLQGMLRCSK